MRLDYHIRRLVPSVAHMSYSPLFKLLNPISDLPKVLNSEYRDLPPNHLRVRIGVGNKILFNQKFHLKMGRDFQAMCRQKGLVRDDSTIVEIGCGVGRIAWPLRGESFVGRYIGIDIDTEMLEWCRAHFDQRFSFHQASHASQTYTGAAKSRYYSLPCADRTVDFMYSISLFTHLLEEELTNYVAESARVLRVGGNVRMAYFCMESVALGDRWTFAHRMGHAYVESVDFPEAAVAFHADYMEGLFRDAGFASVTTERRAGQSILVATR
jgi:cyclopropane fatty-acyl-phospholipid synthase-like methyltransferase